MPLYDPSLRNAQGIIRIKKRFDISVTTIYIGFAALGTLENATGWTIKRITLSAGNPTIEEWTTESTAIWDNRTTETYT